MKFLDLSQPIYDGCPNCPVHPRVVSKVIAQHATDNWHMEHLSLASHTGSHIDAPLHKIAGGKSISDFPLEAFAGDALLVDVRDAKPDQPIGSAFLSKNLTGTVADKIILLATSWGDRRAANDEWHFHSPYLSPDGAQWLVDNGARAVGIDHYSIGGSRDPDNTRTHEILLGANMWVVEDLHFPEITFTLPQPVKFCALPVNFQGFSGSFCRPVIILEV